MSILRGLALPRPWSGHLVPTCTSRSQEGYQAHGHGGSAAFHRPSDAGRPHPRPRRTPAPSARSCPMMLCPELLAGMKAEARKAALARRAGCDPALGRRLAEHILRDAPPPPGAIVAGFWPMGPEIDIRPILLALHGRGHRIAL